MAALPKSFVATFMHWVLPVLIASAAVVCIFAPSYFLYLWGAKSALAALAGYFLLGLLFLLGRQPRLMFTSFACCAGLCLLLKYSANTDLLHPERTGGIAVKVAHFTASAHEDYEVLLEAIEGSGATLISIQDIPFGFERWEGGFMDSTIRQRYPYMFMVTRPDPYSQLAVYARDSFLTIDSIMYRKTPIIVGSLPVPKSDRVFHFVSLYATPPLVNRSFEQFSGELALIAGYTKRLVESQQPVIALGEYNAPPWLTELQRLREDGLLKDSRRSAAMGFKDMLEPPVDYIFYTNQYFKCVDFSTISTAAIAHLGISGTYELKPVSYRQPAGLGLQ